MILLMEEILQHWGYINLVNNGIHYQPQLVLAGFLNHQQYIVNLVCIITLPETDIAPES